MNDMELYMFRCLQLAKLGEGNVAPNPMVGAILVYKNRIIGEGYHKKYGDVHAEVNCIQSVKENDKHLISKSAMFVSLEPCSHFGKTPPCSDLIIEYKIPKVIIGCRDSFNEVNGKGIEKLRAHGIKINEGILEDECRRLNRRFFTFHEEKRPYIILKWAQTANHKIGSNNEKRLLITGEKENRLVNKWRFMEAGILIGTNTALKDDPELTNRFWNGKTPVRLIIDMHLKLPGTLKIFNNTAPTIIFNLLKQSDENQFINNNLKNTIYFKIKNPNTIIIEILQACYKLNIASLLIEGGTKILQSFIDVQLWDEGKIITNTKLFVDGGLNAPVINQIKVFKQIQLNEIYKVDLLISYN